MEKIIAYKANDDEIFKTEEECLAHEKKVQKYTDIASAIREAITICEKQEECCEDCSLWKYFPRGACPIGDFCII